MAVAISVELTEETPEYQKYQVFVPEVTDGGIPTKTKCGSLMLMNGTVYYSDAVLELPDYFFNFCRQVGRCILEKHKRQS